MHCHTEFIVRVADVPAESNEVTSIVAVARRVGVEAEAPNTEMVFVGDADEADGRDLAPGVLAPGLVL
ncbi:hypothetical protein DEJ02_07940 [Curtobacterium sp. MCLR17_042]|nr:hypothetical protein DEJ02_07940 [Curtobacterium sp. MCLR17_042]